MSKMIYKMGPRERIKAFNRSVSLEDASMVYKCRQ